MRDEPLQPLDANDLHNISTYTEWLTRVQALLVTQRLDLTDTDGIYQPTGESHYDAFWRTLCCNRAFSKGSEPPTAENGYDRYLAYLIATEISIVFGKAKPWILGITTTFSPALAYCFRRKNWFLRYALPLAIPSFALLCNIAWGKKWAAHYEQMKIDQQDFTTAHVGFKQGRQFSVTKLGLMGLIPVAARVGDSVGFFAGCRIPYVLRRRGEGYALVGDSYLHGVMNGEGELKETEMLKIV